MMSLFHLSVNNIFVSAWENEQITEHRWWLILIIRLWVIVITMTTVSFVHDKLFITSPKKTFSRDFLWFLQRLETCNWYYMHRNVFKIYSNTLMCNQGVRSVLWVIPLLNKKNINYFVLFYFILIVSKWNIFSVKHISALLKKCFI